MSDAAQGDGSATSVSPNDKYSPSLGDTLLNTEHNSDDTQSLSDADSGIGDMHPGDSLVSQNGLYRLSFQNDGRLIVTGPQGDTKILYGNTIVVDGKSNTGATLRFQRDGNLALYTTRDDADANFTNSNKPDGTDAVWSSNSNYSGDENYHKGGVLTRDARPRAVQLGNDGTLRFWDSPDGNKRDPGKNLLGTIDFGLAKPEDPAKHAGGGTWTPILPVPANASDALKAYIAATSWKMQTLVDMMGRNQPLVVPFVKDGLKGQGLADIHAHLEAGLTSGLSGAAQTAFQDDLAAKRQEATDWETIDKTYQATAGQVSLANDTHFGAIQTAVNSLAGELESVGPKVSAHWVWTDYDPTLSKVTEDYFYRRLDDVLASVIGSVRDYEHDVGRLADGLPLPTAPDPNAQPASPKPPVVPKPPTQVPAAAKAKPPTHNSKSPHSGKSPVHTAKTPVHSGKPTHTAKPPAHTGKHPAHTGKKPVHTGKKAPEHPVTAYRTPPPPSERATSRIAVPTGNAGKHHPAHKQHQPGKPRHGDPAGPPPSRRVVSTQPLRTSFAPSELKAQLETSTGDAVPGSE
ncbi:hypothetical protein [Nocardia stercoris]|uniref:Bulb-type lectin domain-containing protein n=1 Tax=Nocardia stercoris TaxID=2483361 RepID=A0A3M2L142_9NOCA|nr:hypothetical protein [Nocardia stercoris]RMI31459.1 hypothetical protein EBN03_19160 [Nocardia stercoris]